VIDREVRRTDDLPGDIGHRRHHREDRGDQEDLSDGGHEAWFPDLVG